MHIKINKAEVVELVKGKGNTWDFFYMADPKETLKIRIA